MELRGGRFIAGLSGEQFALPEAVPILRKIRSRQPDGGLVTIAASDPLNLVGIITAGSRVPAVAGSRVLFVDGIPQAALIAGKSVRLDESGESVPADWHRALVRMHRNEVSVADSSLSQDPGLQPETA